MRILLLGMALGFALLAPAQASSAASAKPNKAASLVLNEVQVEERLHALSGELRCLVCQNESLASSRAPLAEDLRREVREQIRDGKSNRQIISYLTDRYGDFVTYRPPWSGKTLLLWLGPLLLLILALGMFIRARFRLKQQAIPIEAPSTEALADLRREFSEK